MDWRVIPPLQQTKQAIVTNQREYQLNKQKSLSFTQREALLAVKKGFPRNEKGVSLIGEKTLLQEKEHLIEMKKNILQLDFHYIFTIFAKYYLSINTWSEKEKTS